jgi:uncharacterized SAM-binding protein YcdF (DUF218 family)
MKNIFAFLLNRKWVLILIVFLLLLFGIYLFRFSILRLMGNFLIKQNPIENCDAIFVLSGNANDRATEAAKLFHEGISKKIICTGGNQSGDFKILGLKELESDMIRLKLLQLNIPDSCIIVIHKGTSTFEESIVIKEYCEFMKIDKAIIVSSSFHTRRISSVFDKNFKESKAKILVRAAPSLSYKNEEWWKDEYGLLAVYDEYIKLIYYWIKY